MFLPTVTPAPLFLLLPLPRRLQVALYLQMMQDWLNAYKLDRKALAVLATNLTQVEAYEAYLAHEAEAALDGIIQAVVDGSNHPAGAAPDQEEPKIAVPTAQSKEESVQPTVQDSVERPEAMQGKLICSCPNSAVLPNLCAHC